MARRKCVICGQPIVDNNDSVPYKKRYAHTSCFNSFMKMAAKEKKAEIKEKAKDRKKKASNKKPQAELKEAMSEEEYVLKKSYYDTLRRLIGESKLDVKIYKVSEDYIKKYGFTFEGMQKALEYYFDFLEHEVDGDCIGIIPYYYDKAQSFYQECLEIEEANKNLNQNSLKDMYKVRKIKIQPKSKGALMIDISKIGED